MQQNKSHAVMAQRHEAADSLDFFPTPPWATRALCEWLGVVKWENRAIYSSRRRTVWEPACGQGHMARPLGEFFDDVYASDIHDYGYGDVKNFFLVEDIRHDWIITNPPFNLAENFAKWALKCASDGVALLVRTAFLEGVGRYSRLFNCFAPTDILQFSERVPMRKGRLDPTQSTATAYCWVVWNLDSHADLGTKFHWLPPCRKRLERSEDYVL